MAKAMPMPRVGKLVSCKTPWMPCTRSRVVTGRPFAVRSSTGRPLSLSRSSHTGVAVKIVVRKKVHDIDKNT